MPQLLDKPVRVRQVAIPGDKANWDEHFYTGRLKVIQGVTETDNPIWLEHLLARGFKVIDEEGQVVQAEAPQTAEASEEVKKPRGRSSRSR
jgi:hypothetical protein